MRYDRDNQKYVWTHDLSPQMLSMIKNKLPPEEETLFVNDMDILQKIV